MRGAFAYRDPERAIPRDLVSLYKCRVGLLLPMDSVATDGEPRHCR